MSSLGGKMFQKTISVREYGRARLAAGGRLDTPRVFYGLQRIPDMSEQISGGAVKFQRMQSLFPNQRRNYNVLYLLSSALLPSAPATAAGAGKAGARIVWNQNGVAFPAWHGPGWEGVNRPMREIMRRADHVFYQSSFCKESADRFLGVYEGPWEILYNPVDTSVFVPSRHDPAPGSLVLLLAGSHWQLYRVSTALETLAHLLRRRDKVHLIVGGRFCWKPDPAKARAEAVQIADDLGLRDHVTFTGPYTQQEAVPLMQSAHILLHTKCNDPCPGLVLEAMACGLPVVYSKSGGTPELVGPDGGIGVDSDITWENHTPPDPTLLAEAVLRVAERRREYGAAARERTESRFDLRPWLETHRRLFESLMESRGGTTG
jgi:glycosyltransferase involved in cell wall biosynthesis